MRAIAIVARWVLVLPGALVAGRLGEWAVYWSTAAYLGRPDSFLEYAGFGVSMGVASAAAIVYAGATIAPTRKTATAMVIAGGLSVLNLMIVGLIIFVFIGEFDRMSFGWFPTENVDENLRMFVWIASIGTCVTLLIQMFRGELQFD